MFSDAKKRRGGEGPAFPGALASLTGESAPAPPRWAVPGFFGLVVGVLVTYMLSVTSSPDALVSMQDAVGARLAERTHWSVEKATRDLETLLEECECAPIMLRLAWHDAGTFSKWDGSGGPTGSIRFAPESEHGANAGLAWAREKLESIRANHPGMSYADLYQLAGAVAVKLTVGKQQHRRVPRRPIPPVRGSAQLDDSTNITQTHRRHSRQFFFPLFFSFIPKQPDVSNRCSLTPSRIVTPVFEPDFAFNNRRRRRRRRRLTHSTPREAPTWVSAPDDRTQRCRWIARLTADSPRLIRSATTCGTSSTGWASTTERSWRSLARIRSVGGRAIIVL